MYRKQPEDPPAVVAVFDFVISSSLPRSRSSSSGERIRGTSREPLCLR